MNLRRDFWLLLTLVAEVVIFAGWLLLVWRGEFPVDQTFEMARLLLSWPVVVLVLAFFFLCKFDPQIRCYIENMILRLPGGTVIRSQAPPPAEPNPSTAILSPAKREELLRTLGELRAQREWTETERREILAAYQKAVEDIQLWKFNFLNLFYIPRTKDVLRWLRSFPGQTRQSYNTAWESYIPDLTQRGIILDVLFFHSMAREGDGVIRVTAEGEKFLTWFSLYGTPPAAPRLSPWGRG